MQLSEKVDELFAALAKALGEMPSLPLNKTNPHFKSKYADLAITIEKAKPCLVKNGLMLIQAVENEGVKHLVESMLIHSSGQWLKSRVELILSKQDMQGLGSATTYAKRYAAQSLLFVAGDEDDDGNAASPPPPPKKSPAKVVDQEKAKPAPKPEIDKALNPIFSKADAALMDTIVSLAIDRNISSGNLAKLVNAYQQGNPPPVWVAKEIGLLLELEDCTTETVLSKVQQVTSRIEAKKIKDQAGKK